MSARASNRIIVALRITRPMADPISSYCEALADGSRARGQRCEPLPMGERERDVDDDDELIGLCSGPLVQLAGLARLLAPRTMIIIWG